MAEENTTTDKMVVHHVSAPAPKRITEEQFQRCPSDWLALAKRGQQIIVVREPTNTEPAAMVMGLNGIVFQLPEDEPPAAVKPKAENTWLK